MYDSVIESVQLKQRHNDANLTLTSAIEKTEEEKMQHPVNKHSPQHQSEYQNHETQPELTASAQSTSNEPQPNSVPHSVSAHSHTPSLTKAQSHWNSLIDRMHEHHLLPSFSPTSKRLFTLLQATQHELHLTKYRLEEQQRRYDRAQFTHNEEIKAYRAILTSVLCAQMIKNHRIRVSLRGVYGNLVSLSQEILKMHLNHNKPSSSVNVNEDDEILSHEQLNEFTRIQLQFEAIAHWNSSNSISTKKGTHELQKSIVDYQPELLNQNQAHHRRSSTLLNSKLSKYNPSAHSMTDLIQFRKFKRHALQLNQFAQLLYDTSLSVQPPLIECIKALSQARREAKAIFHRNLALMQQILTVRSQIDKLAAEVSNLREENERLRFERDSAFKNVESINSKLNTLRLKRNRMSFVGSKGNSPLMKSERASATSVRQSSIGMNKSGLKDSESAELKLHSMEEDDERQNEQQNERQRGQINQFQNHVRLEYSDHSDDTPFEVHDHSHDALQFKSGNPVHSHQSIGKTHFNTLNNLHLYDKPKNDLVHPSKGNEKHNTNEQQNLIQQIDSDDDDSDVFEQIFFRKAK